MPEGMPALLNPNSLPFPFLRSTITACMGTVSTTNCRWVSEELYKGKVKHSTAPIKDMSLYVGRQSKAWSRRFTMSEGEARMHITKGRRMGRDASK